MHQKLYAHPAFSEREPLFEVRDLSYRYRDGHRALDGIDLTILEGDRIALVGHNGAGKTTFVKHLNGIYRPERGLVLHRGRPLGTGEDLRRTRLEIGVLFQDPDDQLFCNTVYEDIAFGPLNQGFSVEQADRLVKEASRRTAIEDLLHKPPHQLSYGQKKRAALATLLSMNPGALILDEPTANLDSKQEKLFWDLLHDFTGALIVVSHDLEFLYGLCDRAVVFEQGRIHHDFTMRELVSQPDLMRSHGLDFRFRFQCCHDDGGSDHHHHDHHHHGHDHRHDHDHQHSHANHDEHHHHDNHDHDHEDHDGYRHHDHFEGGERQGKIHPPNPPQGGNLSALPQGGNLSALPQGGNLSALPQGGNLVSPIPAQERNAHPPQGGNPGPHPQKGNSPGAMASAVLNRSLILLEDYSLRYADGTWGLKDFCLEIRQGENVAIVGENGAGKSTLAHCLVGVLSGEGAHSFCGRPVIRGPKSDLWRKVGMIFQNPADQLFCPSCEEEVAFGPVQLGLKKAEVRERIAEALEQVGLGGFEKRVPLHLSAGERKRLAIAAALAMRPETLVLDEPTANLDPQNEEILIGMLERLPMTKILISHDIPLIRALCRRVVVLHLGRKVRDYSLTDFIADSHLESLNGLDYTYRNVCHDEIVALQKAAVSPA